MSETRWLREEWARAWDTLPINERVPEFGTCIDMNTPFDHSTMVDWSAAMLPNATIILLQPGEWKETV